MLKELLIALAVSAAIAAPAFATAAEKHSGECATCHTITEKEATELLKKTGITVISVKQAQTKGLFELLAERDGQKALLFLDYAKKHLVQGVVVNLETLQPVSSHPRDLFQPKQVTSVDPEAIPIENAIIIGNPKGTKKLYVFTDPDCPYCRQFHPELRKLEKIAPDVAIYVIPLPLPMHPGAFDKARVLLEAKSQELLDKIFDGKEAPKPSKDASKAQVDAIIKFANTHGISGTPTLVMPDGTIMVGGRDAVALKGMLEGK